MRVMEIEEVGEGRMLVTGRTREGYPLHMLVDELEGKRLTSSTCIKVTGTPVPAPALTS